MKRKKINGHGERRPPASIRTRNTKTLVRQGPNPGLSTRLWQHQNSQTLSVKGLATPPTGRRNGRGSSWVAAEARWRERTPPVTLLERRKTMSWIRILKVKKLWRSKRLFSIPQTRIHRPCHGGSYHFCTPLEDLRFIRSHNKSHVSSTPKRSTQPPRSSGPVASVSRDQRTPRPREPIHRPHSPKNPPSSDFSTVDLDESDTGLPVVPKRLRKRTVPKIVESAFGRNKQSSPVRSSTIRADSSPGFDLLVERRAARKTGASKHPEVPTSRDDMTWEELQELRRNTPEPGPSSSSTSKRGSVEPRGLSPFSPGNSPLTPRSRPRPALSNTIDATERKMIEAREELSKVALGFRTRLPRSPLVSKSPNTGMNDDETHPFDESTHPVDESTHPFDETTHPFGESQVQSQKMHPFDEDSCVPTQRSHPFDEDTQQPPDSTIDGQSQCRRLEVGESDIRMGVSPVPSTTGGSKRRTEAFLTTSLLETGSVRHSRSLSHPPPASPIDRLRPGALGSPNHPSRSPQNPTSNGQAAPSSPLRRQKVPTPITTSRNLLRSPRSSTEDIPMLSPQRTRAGGVSPDDGRPKSAVTQELRKLIQNSPRTRRVQANVTVQPQTHGEGYDPCWIGSC